MLTFLKYNNIVPLTIAVVLLGAGSTFAAVNPKAILSAQEKVLTADNTYIAQKDLSLYSPQVAITGVTEDADNYYVAYVFTTIDIDNYVWKDVQKMQTLTVSKTLLGDDDLGLYTAGQLKDLVSHEADRLQETQDIARRTMTQKTVATAYSGLVGTFLDEKTETLPGYTPVVAQPVAAPTEPASAVRGASTTPSSNTAPSAPAPLTQEQIEELIRQRVAELLAQNQNSSQPPEDSPSPPAPSTVEEEPEPPPAPEPDPEVVTEPEPPAPSEPVGEAEPEEEPASTPSPEPAAEAPAAEAPTP